MARLVLMLAYPSLLVYTAGATLVVLRLQFACATATDCPTWADPSTVLATQLQGEGRVALDAALVLALAWLLCLAALWHAGRGWGFLALLLALPLGLWLASIAILGAASGTIVPTTWETFDVWRPALWAALLMSFVGPLATIVAAHRLRERRQSLRS